MDQRHGSASKGACAQAQQPESRPRVHAKVGELTPHVSTDLDH